MHYKLDCTGYASPDEDDDIGEEESEPTVSSWDSRFSSRLGRGAGAVVVAAATAIWETMQR